MYAEYVSIAWGQEIFGVALDLLLPGPRDP
jgi:hypothetical protein